MKCFIDFEHFSEMNLSVNATYSIATNTAVLSTTSKPKEGAVCDLTDIFGFFIQGLLAVVAFSTLISK